MSIKIESLKLENFVKYANVEVSFDSNVTYLSGINGSGKSTIGLTGIWFMFQGIAEKASGGNTPLVGERFRFIGPAAPTAKGEMVLVDEEKGVEIKVFRKLTKSGTELRFEAPNGYNLDQQFLNDLFNVFLIAPKRFMELDSRQQALQLGIDTSEHDKKIYDLKMNATLLNRDMKQYETLPDKAEVVEEVDVKALNDQKNNIILFNEEQRQKQEKINQWASSTKQLVDSLTDVERQIFELLEKKAGLEARIETGRKVKDTLPLPQEFKSNQEIDDKISEAGVINHKAMEYKRWLDKRKEKDAKEKDIEDNKQKIKDVEKERLDFIKGKKLPFRNLSIDDAGGLLLDGKPIKPAYFSTGELLKVVPILLSSTNPELKYIFLQDWNLLDEDKQNEVEKYLTDKGFQLVIEYVSKDKLEGKNCILLKDNKIVESYEEQESPAIDL